MVGGHKAQGVPVRYASTESSQHDQLLSVSAWNPACGQRHIAACVQAKAVCLTAKTFLDMSISSKTVRSALSDLRTRFEVTRAAGGTAAALQ